MLGFSSFGSQSHVIPFPLSLLQICGGGQSQQADKYAVSRGGSSEV